jgi:hypothetical protein
MKARAQSISQGSTIAGQAQPSQYQQLRGEGWRRRKGAMGELAETVTADTGFPSRETNDVGVGPEEDRGCSESAVGEG